MKKFVPILVLLLLFAFPLFTLSKISPRANVQGALAAGAQTRERTVRNAKLEVVKVDVDLITVDALVLQKNTARVVGDLKQDDFVVTEDGKKQQVTHFSKDSLPLSVLLLIDRGGCLDPFSEEVHRAANNALARLKPADEVAVMSYHDTAELLQEFTRDRPLVVEALNRIPPHDENANHCLNKAFYEAADYMQKAGNPVGRRVIILITGITRNFDCASGPGGNEAKHAIFESGSVVCGIVPSTGEQRMENGIITLATRVGGVMHVSSLNVKELAAETGGEVFEDKPAVLDQAFSKLIEHLRGRFSLAFVSTNKRRDGSLRKLKIEIVPAAEKARGKLVVKARRSYIAPKDSLGGP
ncbi:MAG TPA: VWA domain-containing protein [Pyrinomonadaceae bacterium]